MSDSVHASLIKFNGKNYQLWKYQMQHVLKSQGLLGQVDGTCAKPTEAVGISKWEKDDSKAFVALLGAMKEEQAADLASVATAKELWDKLSRMCEQKSAHNKITLMSKFQACKMEPTKKVTSFISRLQNMKKALEDVKETVSKTTLIAKILRGLPARFQAFKTSWRNIEPDRQKMDFLEERLLVEEQEMAEETEAVALFGGSGRGKKGGKSVQQQRNDVSNSNKYSKVKCRVCKQLGHIARFYSNRETGPAKNNNNHAKQKPVALVSSVPLNSRQLSKHSRSDSKIFQTMDLSSLWLTDCAASGHITFHREWLTNYRRADHDLLLGDERTMRVTDIGDVKVMRLVDGVWEQGIIQCVWYIPGFSRNLLSIGTLDKRGIKAVYEAHGVTLFKGEQKLAVGEKMNNNMYKLCIKTVEKTDQVQMEANAVTCETNLWHERMAHVNIRRSNDMAREGIVEGLKMTKATSVGCVWCCFGKAHTVSYKPTLGKTKYQVGQFFHTDLCGPITPTSAGGARYILLVVDDASNYKSIFFLKEKSQVFENFKRFEKEIFNKFNRRMIGIRSDRGTEYTNSEMQAYLTDLGI